jgi:hypothetical protein
MRHAGHMVKTRTSLSIWSHCVFPEASHSNPDPFDHYLLGSRREVGVAGSWKSDDDDIV